MIRITRQALANNFPLLIVGSPGAGKTDGIHEASKAENMPLTMRSPVTEESIDYKGCPSVTDSMAKFVPFEDLHALMTAKEPMTVGFDDLGTAPNSVQAALLHVVLAREIAGKKISPHVRFVAATNSRKDASGIGVFNKALISRFTVIDVEPEADTWVKWALANKMPTVLCAFLRFQPTLITTFKPAAQKDITPYACPRSIATLGRWINAGVDDFAVWQGAVGDEFAIPYKAFSDTYAALAGLPDEVTSNPTSARIPSAPDVLFALGGALAHRATVANFSSIATYAARLTAGGQAEFETAILQDCVSRHSELKQTRPYVDYLSRNAAVI